MARKSQGRGAIAAIGLLVLFAGLVGGVVLWYLAATEPNRAAEGFARGAPGCTTTLSFGETGEFYVYEELFGVIDDVEGCEPNVTPTRGFTFELTGPGGAVVERVADDSISYDLDVGQATSVARVSIEVPGDYELSVLGNDPAVVAAVGGDPDANVDRLRRGAIASAAVGIALGVLLLWASGRRSRKAATYGAPDDPGWGVTERDRARRAARIAHDDAAEAAEWPPRPPEVQVPVNPHAPDERRVAQLGGPPPGVSTPSTGPWAAPRPDAVASPMPAPPGADVMASPVPAPPESEPGSDAVASPVPAPPESERESDVVASPVPAPPESVPESDAVASTEAERVEVDDAGDGPTTG